MRSLKKKLDGGQGFTLVEMLIVVAIIAILVAVSIPLVGSSLEKARQATDAANERAARAVATIRYLTDEDFKKAPNNAESDSTNNAYLYDAANGTLVFSGGVFPEGTYKAYGQCADHKDMYLWVQVLENGTIRLVWSKGVGGTFGINWNTGLCAPDLMSGS